MTSKFRGVISSSGESLTPIGVSDWGVILTKRVTQSYNTGMLRNGTKPEPEVIDAQYGHGCGHNDQKLDSQGQRS